MLYCSPGSDLVSAFSRCLIYVCVKFKVCVKTLKRLSVGLKGNFCNCFCVGFFLACFGELCYLLEYVLQFFCQLCLILSLRTVISTDDCPYYLREIENVSRDSKRNLNTISVSLFL